MGRANVGKQMFAMLCRENSGTERGLWTKRLCLIFPSPAHLSPYSAVIPSDSSLPGPGPVSKFFQAVKGEVKISTESVGSWLSSAQMWQLVLVDIRMSKPVEKILKTLLGFIWAKQRIYLKVRSQQIEKNASQNDSLQFLLCIWNQEGNVRKRRWEKARWVVGFFPINNFWITHSFFLFLKRFYLLLEWGKGGRKRGKETQMCERNVDWLPLAHPQLGTWPIT